MISKNKCLKSCPSGSNGFKFCIGEGPIMGAFQFEILKASRLKKVKNLKSP
jgi:hypothetical protein